MRVLPRDAAPTEAIGSRWSPVRHGFRRVDLVRLVIDDDGRWAEVMGAAHRAPRRRRVPFRLAVDLARSGAPVQVVDRRSRGTGESL